MKRAMSILAATLLVTALTGCGRQQTYCVQRGGVGVGGAVQGSCPRCPDVCRDVRPSRCRGDAFDPGMPSGTVTYPYYTVRGPRDFLVSDPPSIGP